MKHQEALELLSLYIDDQLSKQERLDFEEHIKNCPACAEELKQTIAVMDILKNIEPVSPPYDIAKAVTKDLTSPKKHWKLINKHLLRFSAIAAAFVAMIVLTVYNNGSSLNLTLGSSGAPTDMSNVTQSAPPEMQAKGKMVDSYSISTEQVARDSGVSNSLAETPAPAPMAKMATPQNATIDSSQAGVPRKIIQSANMQLSIVKYQVFLTKATAFLKQNAGYIENTNLYKDEQTQKYNAELSLRIPEKKFQLVVDYLQKLGDLKSLNIGSQDVSMQYIDTAARIKTYDTQIAALQTMLAKAKKVDEMLQVQNELTRIQSEHDSLISQNQYIDRSASFATINLSVREEELSKEKILPSQDADVFSKAKAGFILSINNLIAQVQQLFITVVSILPQLLMTGLIIFILLLFYKLKFKK